MSDRVTIQTLTAQIFIENRLVWTWQRSVILDDDQISNEQEVDELLEARFVGELRHIASVLDSRGYLDLQGQQGDLSFELVVVVSNALDDEEEPDSILGDLLPGRP